MWYIKPIQDEQVIEPLREIYDQELKEDGYISNTSRVWSHRPEMIVLWRQFQKNVRAHLRLRTYELVTIASARSMGCVY
jgi:hypothetical protein